METELRRQHEYIETVVGLGEQLHEGNLFFLTNEQHWRLIVEFGICEAIGHNCLLAMLLEIDEYYKVYADFERRNGPLGQHKARLADIAKLSRKLRPLIEAEPLMWHFENEWPSLNSDSLIHFLQMLEQTARELSRNKQYLDRVRFTKNAPKNAERLYIWEPVLGLWTKLGNPLGYSENGPIMRVLRILHDGLMIDHPKPGAVRQTIDDQKGRPRAARKVLRTPT